MMNMINNTVMIHIFKLNSCKLNQDPISGQTIFIKRRTIGGVVLLNETKQIPYVPY